MSAHWWRKRVYPGPVECGDVVRVTPPRSMTLARVAKTALFELVTLGMVSSTLGEVQGEGAHVEAVTIPVDAWERHYPAAVLALAKNLREKACGPIICGEISLCEPFGLGPESAFRVTDPVSGLSLAAGVDGVARVTLAVLWRRA